MNHHDSSDKQHFISHVCREQLSLFPTISAFDFSNNLQSPFWYVFEVNFIHFALIYLQLHHHLGLSIIRQENISLTMNSTFTEQVTHLTSHTAFVLLYQR